MKLEAKSVARAKPHIYKQNQEETCPGGIICHMNHLTINCTDMPQWFAYRLNQNNKLELKPFTSVMVWVISADKRPEVPLKPQNLESPSPCFVDLNTTKTLAEWLIVADFPHSVSKRGSHKILAGKMQAWSAGCCSQVPRSTSTLQPGSAKLYSSTRGTAFREGANSACILPALISH